MKKSTSPRPAVGVALFHHPNPFVDDFLRGDHTHTDENGDEVVSPGTPDRPVVIETDPDPDPPAVATPTDQDAGGSAAAKIEPLTSEKLDALLGPNIPISTGVNDGDEANNHLHVTGPDVTARGHGGNDFIHAGSTFTNSDGGTRYGSADESEYQEIPGNNGASRTEGVPDVADKLYGGSGHDVLVGGAFDDLLDGGPGNDYLYDEELHFTADATAPVIPSYGWSGHDVLIGGPGNDYLLSTAGNNILNGGPGNDHLKSHGGGQTFNILDGGPGNDYLESDGDNDTLIGGSGRDVFDVDRYTWAKIMDFQDGADRIKIRIPADRFSAIQLARDAGIQWDMAWIATETEDGVLLQLDNEATLTILGVDTSDLQFEFVGDDVFIV